MSVDPTKPEQTSNSNQKPLRSLEELAWIYAVEREETIYMPVWVEMEERFGTDAAKSAWYDALDLREMVAPGWNDLT